jgi:hypothetical protein
MVALEDRLPLRPDTGVRTQAVEKEKRWLWHMTIIACRSCTDGQEQGVPEKSVDVREVREVESRSGNTRWVLKDGEGNEYTTFRPEIGRKARAAEGSRARIEFHEQQRGDYRNVYLDGVEPVAPAGDVEDPEADEVGWRTAIEAAPWLAGEPVPDKEVPPDELFEKLKPFKDLVERDIEEEDDGGRG